jgi:SAM-dependent methyltransferase
MERDYSMSRDVLLYGLSQSEPIARLLQWARTTPELHDFPAPDAHRLQLEHWVWSHRAQLGYQILDIGVYVPRTYLGPGYLTFGESGEDTRGDLLALPFMDDSFDGLILTEVLEHCINPHGAMREVFRVLKPGGLLLVTSPFVWPWHGTEAYHDYWRFTHEGWLLLLQAFTQIDIRSCAWTVEGEAAYDIMRRFECMGFANQTKATTGYLCAARKPS